MSNATPAFFYLLQKACPFRLIVNQIEISLMKLDFFKNGSMEQCMLEKVTPLAWSRSPPGVSAFPVRLI